jgi:hypothetical protein
VLQCNVNSAFLKLPERSCTWPGESREVNGGLRKLPALTRNGYGAFRLEPV